MNRAFYRNLVRLSYQHPMIYHRFYETAVVDFSENNCKFNKHCLEKMVNGEKKRAFKPPSVLRLNMNIIENTARGEQTGFSNICWQ